PGGQGVRSVRLPERGVGEHVVGGVEETQCSAGLQLGHLRLNEELLSEPRPHFTGELRVSGVTGRLEPEYPVWRRNLTRYLVTLPIIFASLLAVFIVMLLILQLQDLCDAFISAHEYTFYLSYAPKVLMALAISAFDEAYTKVAVWLNDLENYRVEDTYQNHLIIKLAVFRFVNSFLSLFYIAFYLQDMERLKEQLAALLLTRQVVGNIKESCIPYLLEQFKLAKLSFDLYGALSPSEENQEQDWPQENPPRPAGLESQVLEEGEENPTGTGSITHGSSSNSITKDDVVGLATAPEGVATPCEGNTPGDGKVSGTGTPVKGVTPEAGGGKDGTGGDKEGTEGGKEDSGEGKEGTAAGGGKEGGKDGGKGGGGEAAFLARGSSRNRIVSQAEVECNMSRYEGTFEDYLEMFIQFGYVTLFSSAFPLAAMCAFLNNLIEIRSDAFKLCCVFQRPFGIRAQSIGVWQDAMELMGVLGIMVNCMLIGLSGQVHRMFPHMSTTQTVLLIIVLEHAMIALKYGISYAIPDIPEWVATEIAKVEFQRREALRRLSTSNSPPTREDSQPSSPRHKTCIYSVNELVLLFTTHTDDVVISRAILLIPQHREGQDKRLFVDAARDGRYLCGHSLSSTEYVDRGAQTDLMYYHRRRSFRTSPSSTIDEDEVLSPSESDSKRGSLSEGMDVEDQREDDSGGRGREEEGGRGRGGVKLGRSVSACERVRHRVARVGRIRDQSSHESNDSEEDLVVTASPFDSLPTLSAPAAVDKKNRLFRFSPDNEGALGAPKPRPRLLERPDFHQFSSRSAECVSEPAHIRHHEDSPGHISEEGTPEESICSRTPTPNEEQRPPVQTPLTPLTPQSEPPQTPPIPVAPTAVKEGPPRRKPPMKFLKRAQSLSYVFKRSNKPTEKKKKIITDDYAALRECQGEMALVPLEKLVAIDDIQMQPSLSSYNVYTGD
ncbi:hypothetical protein Pcinc_036878, partial [Petrolisthes cinctipes]